MGVIKRGTSLESVWSRGEKAMLPGAVMPGLSLLRQSWGKKEEKVCRHKAHRYKGMDVADRAWK